jgi:hypothetical protein
VLTPAHGGASLGSARFAIASGKAATLTLTLSGSALRALHEHGRLNVLVTATARDAAGRSMTTTSRLTLVNAKSSHRRRA